MISRVLRLDHLVALSDDVGPIQHARRDVPNRSTGYCTDDVGRALIVAVEAARDPATAASGATLVRRSLAFLVDAQLRDGWFHGFMGYDRRWQDHRGTSDAFGRAVWGLGHAAARAPQASWRLAADELFAAALPRVAGLTHLRSRAYAALGLIARLAPAPADTALRATLYAALEPLAAAYEMTNAPDWRWCEDVLTYDNARLCEALLAGGELLDNARFRAAGRAMLDFYAETTIERDVFVPIGNAGWFPRGGQRARFGQQPLEAAALVGAALAADRCAARPSYRELARLAHAWYFGRNSAGATLVVDGGCCDGIDEAGVNRNMGAESTVSYLLSEVAMRGVASEPSPPVAKNAASARFRG